MKVGTKLALGGALAVLPMAGGLAAAVRQVQALSAANDQTVESQHRAAQLALEVLRGIELTGEYERKLAITRDGDYRAKLAEVRAKVTRWIAELSTLRLSEAEAAAVDRLSRVWTASSAPDPVEASRSAANALLEANSLALEAHARWAEAESRKTERLALIVALAALAASALVISLLVRSLQQPLRQLTRGTRAVAKGDFEYRAVPLANDELGQVTEAINHMVDSLGALERVKAELVSRVSHELRTPLVAMVETNRLLLDEIAGPVNHQQRRMLELHASAAERLSVMIRDLLDLSTLEANPALERDLVDLVPLTREIVDQLAPLALERSLHLDVGFSTERVVVRGDARRYQQVVQNFLDNALEHSPPNGVVHVGLGVMGADTLAEPYGRPDEKPIAVLRVDDEGPGVAHDERERIFDKFAQGAGARRGVGLGLAICRQITTAHGGLVGVTESTLGGASFFAAFPIAAHEEP